MAVFSKMKLSIAVFVLLQVLFTGCEQKNRTEPGSETKLRRIPVSVNDSLLLAIDKSPMDISYFPEDYPQQKMVTPDMENPVTRVIYSRPKKNGRIIFADTSVTENVIQHYGQEWRLGANEASEIEFFKEVTVNGKKISPGRYIIYCIPSADTWKIIINKNLYSWGLHIDKAKDLAEMDIPVLKNDVQIEYFTMLFQKAAYGCDLVMAWGDAKARLPINFK